MKDPDGEQPDESGRCAGRQSFLNLNQIRVQSLDSAWSFPTGPAVFPKTIAR